MPSWLQTEICIKAMANLLLGFLCCVYATHTVRAACHGNHCPVPGEEEVDSSIEHIEWHYNDKLCLEILLIDCSTHITQNDEIICGSNGKQYDNHCRFAHARCTFLHSDEPLTVAFHGPCPSSTTPAHTPPPPATPTAAASTTATTAETTVAAAATTTAAPFVPGSTETPNESGVQSSTTVVVPHTTAAHEHSTAIHTTPTPAPPTTTITVSTTTVDTIHSIIQNVFCKNPDSITCDGGFNFVCGSDGKLYPNECEMSKAKCTNPSLIAVDLSLCGL